MSAGQENIFIVQIELISIGIHLSKNENKSINYFIIQPNLKPFELFYVHAIIIKINVKCFNI